MIPCRCWLVNISLSHRLVSGTDPFAAYPEKGWEKERQVNCCRANMRQIDDDAARSCSLLSKSDQVLDDQGMCSVAGAEFCGTHQIPVPADDVH